MNVAVYLHAIGALILTGYVVVERNRWTRIRQGLKAIGLGVALIALCLVLFIFEGGALEKGQLTLFAGMHDQERLGATRMLSGAYLAFMCGVEILIAIFLKRLVRKQKEM